MTRKRSFKSVALFSFILVILLSGCFEKSFENKNISFKGSATMDVAVGEIKSLSYVLPDNGVETFLSASCDSDILSAVIKDDQLILTGNKVGECTLTFTLSAKGYKSAQSSYKVNVQNLIEISAFCDGKDVSDGISLPFESTVLLNINCNPNTADIKLAALDNSIISVTKESDHWMVNALSPGKSDVEIMASADGYRDTVISIPVEVTKTEALLSLSAESVNSFINTSAVVNFECQESATVTAASDNPAVTVKVNGNAISVFSDTPGSYNVTVRCESENYTASQKSFTVVFSKPTVSFITPKSFELFSGEQASFAIADYPVGTYFSVSSSPKLDVSIQNGRVVIFANAAGSDVITITAQKEGYQTTQVKIPVTMKAVTTEIKQQYMPHIKEIISLVNKERTSRGLNPLYYLGELEQSTAIRAEEASDRWSHTRPDGREWQTVLYDTGVSFIVAGENLIEINAFDAKEAVNAWMASKGHRENILRENFVYTCVGIYKSGSTYWYCQHFIER